MKKFLVTLFALFLTLSLTACGSNGKNEQEDKKGNESSEVESGEEGSSESVAEKIELYSDSTKMVFKNGNTQLVYYYSGEEITAYHAYIDYENAATANYALTLIEKDDETIAKAYTKGRYLVVEYAKSEYEDLKTSEVRALYSYLEQIQK